jgi:hypothetical protein
MREARQATARPFRGRPSHQTRASVRDNGLSLVGAGLAGQALRPVFERDATKLICEHVGIPVEEVPPEEVLSRDGAPVWGRILAVEDKPTRVQVAEGLTPRERNFVLSHEAAHLLGWPSEIEAQAFARGFTDWDG